MSLPAFLVGVKDVNYCSSSGGWYSCSSSVCRFQRPCRSDPGLWDCSCSDMTQDDRIASVGREGVTLASPCLRVEVGKSISEWEECAAYLRLPLHVPTSNCSAFPRILHGVGKDRPSFSFLTNAARNPSFRTHFLSDADAARYILAHCGRDARAAYDCFVAPAYRADLARFCFLYAEGGVYVDSDIMLLDTIPKVASLCASATVGHDIPQKSLPPIDPALPARPGKQMKILSASRPEHPLFRCMLHQIVRNVRTRFVSKWPLEITGPQLLHTCFEKTQKKDPHMHVTYRDTRGAAWPYAGMMGRRGLLAIEVPGPIHFNPDDIEEEGGARTTSLSSLHYTELLAQGILYRNSCAL